MLLTAIALLYNIKMGAKLCSQNTVPIDSEPIPFAVCKRTESDKDEPSPEVAKPVQSHIDISAKVR